MRGLQLLNSDKSLREGEVRNDELQGVSITHLQRVINISLHNFAIICGHRKNEQEPASSERQGDRERGTRLGSRSTPHTDHNAQHAMPSANQPLEREPVMRGWKDGARRAAWPGEKNMKGGSIR